MNATTREILNRAADLVEQGWIQGAMFRAVDGVKCYCLLGAIYKAAPTDEIGDTAYWTIADHLGVMGWKRAAAYNNAPGRTQSEVVALLREVANA